MPNNDQELLHDAIANGIIDISYVRDALEMKTRQELLDQHKYEIYEGKDGKWYTYLPDKEKGRLFRKRATRKQIEDVVIAYWREQTDNPTIADIFSEWNDRRLRLGKISPSTHNRYKWDFQRYYSSFGKRRIKAVSPDEIEDFMEEQIAKYQLTAKAYSNLRTISKGFLKYAKKKKFICFAVEELFADMDISDRSFRKTIKEDYEEVFDDLEKDRIMEYLIENLDILNIGILLLFLTGLRVGELVVLKHTDICGNTIQVRRTETRYLDENNKLIFQVKEYPKSKAGVRTALIPKDYSWIVNILANLNADGEFIFYRNNSRITTDRIRCRLKRVCKRLDIYPKAPHKIRKTYGSILLDNHIDKCLITELMGHSDIFVTENFYHRNRRCIDEKIAKISTIPELMAKQKGSQNPF